MWRPFIGWLGFTFTVVGVPTVLLPLMTQCGVFVFWGIDRLVSGSGVSLAKNVMHTLPQLMGTPDGRWWIGALYLYADSATVIVLVGGAFLGSILVFATLVVISGGPMRLPPSPPWCL